jgi:anti-sigma B factor antagonist
VSALAPSQLRIESVRSGSLAIVVPYGELDMTVTDDLQAAINAALKSQPLIIGIDLRGLTFIDSSGIHALLKAGHRSHAEGRRFFLVRGSEHIDRLLFALGMDGLFEIVSDLDHLTAAGF